MKKQKNKNLKIIVFISLSVVFFSFSSISFVLAKDTNTKLINVSIQKNVPGKDVVVFNVQNKKMHKPNCEWADKCTKNCIYISREEAIKRGGIPCQVCGGPFEQENEEK